MAVITISRQFGAGGITFGKRLSESINYTLYDSELIQLVSEKANVSPNWVETLEKEAGGKFHRFLSGVVPKNPMDRILDDNHKYFDEEIYIDFLYEIVAKIADEDNAVIIGRGSQYILQSRKNAIHLLLLASKDDRIRFIQDKYGLKHREAVSTVYMEDKRRINLFRNFSKTGYDDPSLYGMGLAWSKVHMDDALEAAYRIITRQSA